MLSTEEKRFKAMLRRQMSADSRRYKMICHSSDDNCTKYERVCWIEIPPGGCPACQYYQSPQTRN